VTTLVIFGITGDLSRRKLLPALQAIVKAGREDISIVGVSRRDVDVKDLLADYPELIDYTSVYTMDLSVPESYVDLKENLMTLTGGRRLYYLAVPPGAATDITDHLGAAGLNTPDDAVLFEKPFGFDSESAEDMIRRTHKYYDEEQLYRIDHYMAKEVAREIIRLRKNADGHHHHWSNKTVSRVEIVAHETIGVESRAVFYEQAGAIRDVIQGHLMQLLSLVLMRPPTSLEGLPAARREALEQLLPLRRDDVVKAQYDGYREEVGAPNSKTETYAKLTLFSDDPAWAGVPFVLETGKRMPEKRTIVRIVYRDGSEDIFDESQIVYEQDTRLKDAYEHVLIAAIDGERAIFTTSEEVLASWRVIAGAVSYTHI